MCRPGWFLDRQSYIEKPWGEGAWRFPKRAGTQEHMQLLPERLSVLSERVTKDQSPPNILFYFSLISYYISRLKAMCHKVGI